VEEPGLRGGTTRSTLITTGDNGCLGVLLCSDGGLTVSRGKGGVMVRRKCTPCRPSDYLYSSILCLVRSVQSNTRCLSIAWKVSCPWPPHVLLSCILIHRAGACLPPLAFIPSHVTHVPFSILQIPVLCARLQAACLL
jgi:hypothetical protein